MGTVLVVDDIAANCRLLESLLAPDGHVVSGARDGDEAVRAVHDEPPDLILMDVMMPGVDGFEACRAIKQDPGTRLILVVLVTALNDTASRIRGIDVGADDFVTKPFNTRELRACIRSLLLAEAADGDPRRDDFEEIHKAATAALDLLRACIQTRPTRRSSGCVSQ